MMMMKFTTVVMCALGALGSVSAGNAPQGNSTIQRLLREIARSRNLSSHRRRLVEAPHPAIRLLQNLDNGKYTPQTGVVVETDKKQIGILMKKKPAKNGKYEIRLVVGKKGKNYKRSSNGANLKEDKFKVIQFNKQTDGETIKEVCETLGLTPMHKHNDAKMSSTVAWDFIPQDNFSQTRSHSSTVGLVAPTRSSSVITPARTSRRERHLREASTMPLGEASSLSTGPPVIPVTLENAPDTQHPTGDFSHAVSPLSAGPPVLTKPINYSSEPSAKQPKVDPTGEPHTDFMGRTCTCTRPEICKKIATLAD